MSRREQIQEMLKQSPDDLFLNYAYAMELAKEGDISAGRQAFARVRELNPDYVPAYFQEGQMLAAADDNDEARKILQQGMDVARRVNDSHALGEMSEFLDNL